VGAVGEEDAAPRTLSLAREVEGALEISGLGERPLGVDGIVDRGDDFEHDEESEPESG
jgi:hypothetical protein